LVSIPNLCTQGAIAEILSSLDDKIELNNKINQELETLAQTLFKRWFIDFEFPNENGEPYKSSGGEMVDSELGEIPKGWKSEYLCVELNIAYGKNLPTTKLENSGYDVFGGNGIIGKYHKFLYEEPQVLIACRGAASGKINISNRKSFVTNNSLIIEYDNSNTINFTYLKYWSLFQDFTKSVSGSAQPQITIENLSSNLILVPEADIVDFFSSILSDEIEKIDTISLENKELYKIRDTLLPKLISGELEVNQTIN
jgi:type I restriction enzyme S subunit